MKRPLLLFTAFFWGLGLVGCSVGFNRDWNKEIQTEQGALAKDLAGAWRGTWRSEVSGHHGDLRALATLKDAKSGTYVFRYHATYGKIFSGGYAAEHVASRHGDHYTLTGEKNLGAMLGDYHFNGTATPQKFKASYWSGKDRGIFEMSRP